MSHLCWFHVHFCNSNSSRITSPGTVRPHKYFRAITSVSFRPKKVTYCAISTYLKMINVVTNIVSQRKPYRTVITIVRSSIEHIFVYIHIFIKDGYSRIYLVVIVLDL